MELVIVVVAVILAVWLLGLHRPIQSGAESLTSLAEAGEVKARIFTASVKADAVKSLNETDFPDEASVEAAKAKIKALNSLSL